MTTANELSPIVREFIVAFVRGETDRMWKHIHEEFHAVNAQTAQLHHKLETLSDYVSALMGKRTEENVVQLRALSDSETLDDALDALNELPKTEPVYKPPYKAEPDTLHMPDWVRKERNQLLEENEKLRNVAKGWEDLVEEQRECITVQDAEIARLKVSLADWKAEATALRDRYQAIRQFFADK